MRHPFYGYAPHIAIPTVLLAVVFFSWFYGCAAIKNNNAISEVDADRLQCAEIITAEYNALTTVVTFPSPPAFDLGAAAESRKRLNRADDACKAQPAWKIVKLLEDKIEGATLCSLGYRTRGRRLLQDTVKTATYLAGTDLSKKQRAVLATIAASSTVMIEKCVHAPVDSPLVDDRPGAIS